MVRSQVSEPHAARIAAVRDRMSRLRLDGYLVADRMDQYWLTGFTGEDGFALVTHRTVVLLTDGRFGETARKEAPFARAVLRKVRSAEATVKELNRCKVKRLGYEPDHLRVSAFAELRKAAKRTRLVAARRLIGGLRETKDASEITRIRGALRVAEEAFRQLSDWLRPGMTEREVAARLEYEMKVLGAQEPAFGSIVAVGEAGSLPHYEPSDRKVTAKDGVLIDWGARAGWYVSDLTRVVWPGSIPPELGKVYEVVREAHDRAIAVIRPGVSASAVDHAARDHIRKSGYDKQFIHSVGHAIGLNVHEAPGLRSTTRDLLKPGMVVTVEPGIYLPGVGGVRIEDDVLVTETGYDVLSTLPTDLDSMRLRRR